MKALSLRQAARCETAKTPKCKCRCHGALHGVHRAKGAGPPGEPLQESDLDLAFFEALPADDPHHIDDAETKKQKRKSSAKSAKSAKSQISQGVPKSRKVTIETIPERQLPLIPPGLEQEMLGSCAQCGQAEWVHKAYWAATVGAADHAFQPKEQP